MSVPDPPTITILFIEDDYFLLDLYRHVFEKEGYRILVATDGEQGIALAQKRPNLILLDIMLPKKNGLQVLSVLKKDRTTKNIPIILLTNLGQKNIIKQAFAMGAQGYVLKLRIDPYKLLQYTKEYLANPHRVMDLDTIDFD